jgi:hypothetical protein
MDRYDTRKADLEREIARCAALKHAAEPGSAFAVDYQARITRHLHEIATIEAGVSEARKLDLLIEVAREDVDERMDQLAHDRDGLRQFATVTGGVGLGLGLLSLLWSPTWWMPVIAVVLLGVAGVSVWQIMRHRQAALNAVRGAEDELAGYRSQRRAAALQPIGQHSTRVADEIGHGEVQDFGGLLREGRTTETAVIEGELVARPVGVHEIGEHRTEQIGDGDTTLTGFRGGVPHRVVGEFDSDLHAPDGRTLGQG